MRKSKKQIPPFVITPLFADKFKRSLHLLPALLLAPLRIDSRRFLWKK